MTLPESWAASAVLALVAPLAAAAQGAMVPVPGGPYAPFQRVRTVNADEPAAAKPETVAAFSLDVEPVTNAEFTAALARVLKRPAPWLVPGFALKTLLGEFAEEGLLGGQRAIPAALERAGFEFHHNTIGEALSYAISSAGG